jgi:hypothetical protein
MDKDQRSIANDDFLRELLLTSEDVSRGVGSLHKLARHFAEPVVLTGSIAAGWHLLNSGRRPSKTHLNDIDTVALRGPSGIGPALGRDFLVNHFHPYRGGGRVLLQLVDEEQRTRVEVFTPGSDSLAERLIDSAVGDVPCRLVSAEDLLAKLLSIIHPAAEGEPVDPKYVERFDSLSAAADMDVVRRLWREYRREGRSADFDEAARLVKSAIASDPGLLRAADYCQDVDLRCEWCHESESFPVASRLKVHEVLGYV